MSAPLVRTLSAKVPQITSLTHNSRTNKDVFSDITRHFTTTGTPKTPRLNKPVKRLPAALPRTPSNSGGGQKAMGALRVRRTRAADTSRVLAFVRDVMSSAEHKDHTCSYAAVSLVLNDYIARTLAEGRTLLAEQHEAGRGPRRLVGVALGSQLCSWDAALVERWAACVLCARSRALLKTLASCLRDPALHERYQVERILQILLLVEDSPRTAQVGTILAKTAIKKGQEAGYPLVRLDVINPTLANALSELPLKKEWELVEDKLQELCGAGVTPPLRSVSVYSATSAALASSDIN